jgi:hypothetical protein
MSLNKEEIKKQINETINEINQDVEKLKALNDSLGFSYLQIRETDEITKRLRLKFPLMVLSDISFNYDFKNNFEHLATEIFYSDVNKEKLLLDKIGFLDINLDKQTVTLYSDKFYYLHHLKLFGAENVEKDNIKEFQNGKTIIKFKDVKTFEILKNIVFFDNELTQTIIKNITDKDVIEYKRLKTISSANIYQVIYGIKERLGIVSNHVNFNSYVIIKEFERRSK